MNAEDLNRALISAEVVGMVQGMLALGVIHPRHIERCKLLVSQWNATFSPPPETQQQAKAMRAAREIRAEARQ